VAKILDAIYLHYIFSCGDLLRIMCTFQILLANVNDLRARITGAVAEVTLTSNVTPGNKFIIGGTFVLLPLEVISNYDCDASEKNFTCVATFLYI
jgi:hypothetical protein